MDSAFISSLEVLAEHGQRLNNALRFCWPQSIQQAVHRLRLDAQETLIPSFVAVVGGASSGKSTVFNNLMNGKLASRITARGHCTVGPILAVHEEDRTLIEAWLSKRQLLPDRRHKFIELDDNVTGEPDTLSIAFHDLDDLKGILLFDTPDFTSEAAAKEGDVSMSLLPWFDRLIVVVDHERWFDRQSISDLRRESRRFGQDRVVLFNRTREGELAASDEAALRKQAERLEASQMSVLQFRRGRGCSRFAPGTLDKTVEFLKGPLPSRLPALQKQLSEAANQVLNQNEERAARLIELKQTLSKTVDRVLPSAGECMTSLMMPQERRQLEVAYRVLHIQETKDWIRAQQQRLRRALGSVPIVGSFVRPDRTQEDDVDREPKDRLSLATAYFESVARKLTHEVRWSLCSSTFWDELRRWTELEPLEPSFEWSKALQDDVAGAAKKFDDALTQWTTKVESECQGMAPHLQGAIGVGVLAIAVVLIAVPGPVAALTLVSAKGAIAGVIGKLAAATGAGALAGKHAGRLTSVIREKLVGSEEFNAVHNAATAFREHLVAHASKHITQALSQASALVMDDEDALIGALHTACPEAE